MRSAHKHLLVAVLAALALSTQASSVMVAQRSSAIAGASFTLLSDGRWLRLGGTDARGATRSAAIVSGSGEETILEWALDRPRAGHTATMLSDGHVLVAGGRDGGGQLARTFEVIDPQVGVVDRASAPDALQRVAHTATLLIDGTVVFVGGYDAAGKLADAGTWDPHAESVRAWQTPATWRRAGHAAALDAAGNVAVSGGSDARGRAVTTTLEFRPATSDVVITTLDDQAETPDLVESVPTNGQRDVSLTTRIAMRFLVPLDVTTALDVVTVTTNDGTETPFDVVSAEGGRLVFVNPHEPLKAGVLYRVSIDGLQTQTGQTLAARAFTFLTRDAEMAGTNTDETVEKDLSSRTLPPLQAAQGTTALAGQVLQLNGQPLQGVTLKIGGQASQSDATGRFLLTDVGAGHQVLFIDGRTASPPGREYGIFEAGVELREGRTVALPYTIWMTRLDLSHAITIPSPTTQETVITTPKLPGLELRLPAGTTIVGNDGEIVRQVSITPVPIDRPPFPLPAGVRVPIYFTIQPGAAYLRMPSGMKARLIYPNSAGQPIGTVFDFWNYDADARGWYVYGEGRVVPPGRQISPDPNVGIYEFSGAMVADTTLGAPTGPAGPPTRPGPTSPPTPDNDRPKSPAPPEPPKSGGEPVDLGSGLFVYERTDMSLDDSWPLRLTRVYRPGDSRARPFGIGTTHNYELLLLGDSTSFTFMDLVLPDGSRVHYPRISSGTGYLDALFQYTAGAGEYLGSTLLWNGAAWDLHFLDGRVYTFPMSVLANVPALAALTGMRDRYGNTVTLVRDGSTGNLTKIISPHGRTLTFSYGTKGITSITDNIGRVTQYSYDSSGRLATVTDPDSKTTQYTYDTSNRMLTLTDRRNTVYLTNQYDSAGRVSQQTLADGHTYQFSYTVNGSGQITQTDVTDPAGIVRRVAFNSAGFITSDTHAYGLSEAQTTTYARDSSTNLITSMTDALGRQTTYTYDATGSMLTVTRLAGTSNAVTTTFTYDPLFHLLATTTDPLSHTSIFIHDGLGNLVATVDPLSRHSTLSFTSAGQISAITDPLGNVVSRLYDSGLLASVTDPLGRSQLFGADAAGRIVESTDALGHRAMLTYDVLDRLTQKLDPIGGTTAFSFDDNGNLLAVTDAKSHSVTYTYNSMDRATTRTDPLTHQDSYVYDANGLVTSHTDRRSKVTACVYDGLGRMTTITYDDGSTATYTYDAGNRITQIVDSVSGTITRTYDDLDRLTNETTPQGAVSYTYDAAGRRTSMTVAGQTAITYAYDVANELTSITQGSTVVSFTYDGIGRRATTTYPNNVVATYAYDAASQITGITFAHSGTTLGTLTYTYDAAGNRTQVGGTFAGTVPAAAVSSTTYDAANRLTTWGVSTLTYDLAGNLTSDGTNTYTWNARNQLALISGGTSASFAYDAIGRRNTRAVGSTTTSVLYDGVNNVQELDASLTPTANLITGLGVDEALVRTDSAGTVSLLLDALGSVVSLTSSSGAIATEYTYGPFGDVSLSGSSSSNATEFTGRESDGTGLFSYRARYYSPTFSRFVSEDPSGFSTGETNLYAYVSNNPIVFVDPFGLDKTSSTKTTAESCNSACQLDKDLRQLGNSVQNNTRALTQPSTYMWFLGLSATGGLIGYPGAAAVAGEAAADVATALEVSNEGIVGRAADVAQGLAPGPPSTFYQKVVSIVSNPAFMSIVRGMVGW